MNIFVLDEYPHIAARYHCDKHVVKMITESCQLLSTWAHSNLPNRDWDILYKPTHIHHPCNLWLNESHGNVVWLHDLLFYLIREYDFRYEKTYNFQRARAIYGYLCGWIRADNLTPFKLCMPDEFKVMDPIESYRNYYRIAKAPLLKYTKREKPLWLTN